MFTETLQNHIEHVILIKLGKMSASGTLTFDAYTATKKKHRQQIRDRLRNNEIEVYNFDIDLYGRIDAKMADEEENASRFGSLTKRDRDRIIQTQVCFKLIGQGANRLEDRIVIVP